MATIDPITRTLPDGTEVLIRTLEGGDAAAFIRFMKEALSTSKYLNKYPHEYTLTTWKQRAILRHRMATRTSLTIGMFHKDEMIGMLTSKGDSRLRHAHKVEMGIAIKQGWRGRGMGRALMEHFIDWCRKTPPLVKIELNVNAENHRAITLYETLGFQKEGQRRLALKLNDGHFSDELIMGLVLHKQPTGESA